MKVRVEMAYLTDFEDREVKRVEYVEDAASTVSAIIAVLDKTNVAVTSLKVHAAVEREVTGQPKFPRICVRLGDGDMPTLVGRVARAMAHHSVPPEEISAYNQEAAADAYENALIVTQRWVGVR